MSDSIPDFGWRRFWDFDVHHFGSNRTRQSLALGKAEASFLGSPINPKTCMKNIIFVVRFVFEKKLISQVPDGLTQLQLHT
jgi:hypothetical protein